MDRKQEHVVGIVRFRHGLAKVVELGYGNDECEHVVMVMFEDLVRQVVPCSERDKLTFALPIKLPEKENTYANLLLLATELLDFAENNAAALNGKSGRCPLIFPFLTTLGISGGMFLIAFHVARLAPLLLQHSMHT